MVILDITDVQPYDVLLTSGHAKSSRINKKAQAIIRRMDAPYSHSSMFVSPFLLIESLDDPAIVLSDLFRSNVSPQEKPDDSRQPNIYVRSEAPLTRLYARLDGVDAAEVRRYTALQDASESKLLDLLDRVINVIELVYLAKYPPIIRLARTARIISEQAAEILEKIGKRWEKKRITGPFCSELVTMLLGEIDPSIYGRHKEAAAIAPSDIYNDNKHFRLISRAQPSPHPEGIELEGVSAELGRCLRVDALDSQQFNIQLVQLTAVMPDIVKTIDASDHPVFQGKTAPVYYKELLAKLRGEWLSGLREHALDAAMVMNWIHSAKACAETCPKHRPVREDGNGGLRFFRPAWTHSGAASAPCADARYCANSAPSWTRLSSFCVCFYGWNRVDEFFSAWRAAGFKPAGHIVWKKEYASSARFLQYRHEQAYLLVKGNPGRPAKPLADVQPWQYSGNRAHPTEKAVEILKPLIRAFSKPGDIVLDPFAGSGSTAVSASLSGRRYIGIELEGRYCQLARKRLAGAANYIRKAA